MAESRKAKNLRIASWILLTVVPAIFAVGFDAKGYVAKAEQSLSVVTILEPKVSKMETELSLNGLNDLFTKTIVDADTKRVDRIIDELKTLDKSVTELTAAVTASNANVEQIILRNNKFWDEDWSKFTSKIDKLIDRKK